MNVYAVCVILLSRVSAENFVSIYPSPVASVKEGESLDLQCVFTGSSNPEFIHWYLNDDPYGLVIGASNCMYLAKPACYETNRYETSCRITNFTLSITNISKSEDDDAIWKCDTEITGVNGSVTASTRIRVIEAVITDCNVEGNCKTIIEEELIIVYIVPVVCACAVTAAVLTGLLYRRRKKRQLTGQGCGVDTEMPLYNQPGPEEVREQRTEIINLTS